MTASIPSSGDEVLLTPAVSPQFASRLFAEPVAVKVIRVTPATHCDGWAWLDGYQLDQAGEAVERRTVFVRVAALRRNGHR